MIMMMADSKSNSNNVELLNLVTTTDDENKEKATAAASNAGYTTNNDEEDEEQSSTSLSNSNSSSGSSDPATTTTTSAARKRKPAATAAAAEAVEMMITEDDDEQYFVKHDNSAYKILDRVYNTFADGVRSIDFLIVYDERITTTSTTATSKIATTTEAAASCENGGETKSSSIRRTFLANLVKAGLELEEDVVSTDKLKIHFIKLHIPWPLLTRYAEELSFRVPIKIYQNDGEMDFTEGLLRKLKLDKLILLNNNNNTNNNNKNSININNKPTMTTTTKSAEYFTCVFRRSHISKYIPSSRYPAYISTTQRQSAIYEVLQTTEFGRVSKGEVGINRLLRDGHFSDAFPLHDGPYGGNQDSSSAATSSSAAGGVGDGDGDGGGGGGGGSEDIINPRKELYLNWARYSNWYKYQPIDSIRDYFGEKVSLYFAWLGAYTHWLLVPAIVGLAVFLLSLTFLIKTNNNSSSEYETYSEQVCKLGRNITMCPDCDGSCNYWNLSESCFQSRLSAVVDNPYTIFYAIFMTIWAFSFLEYWKRKNVSLAYRWNTLDFEEEEERPRTEFIIKSEMTRINPITGEIEPAFPKSKKYIRMVAAFTTILFMISLVLIFIFAIIIYRILLNMSIFKYQSLRSYSSMISSMSSALLNLIVIMILGKFYENLAYKLTEWEMHKTQTEFENHLTFKVFIFQFINYYSSLFYIAFVKGKFIGYPGHYSKFFGLRAEECEPGGCLVELTQQLAIIMVGKQMIGNVQEIIIPKLHWLIRRFVTGLSSIKLNRPKTQIENDYELIAHDGLFDEYIEMVLQFGFITNFVVAFPLAPLFALLNNWVEIRLDAKKFVCSTKRPVAQRAGSIGVWFDIITVLVHISAIGNAFLIAFTSEFLPRLLYRAKHDWSLKGYVEFSLATAPSNNTDLSKPCKYFAYRDQNGNLNEFYWQLLAVRLLFVILFEHILFFISKLIDFLVPDVPENLLIKIRRERYLAKKALQDTF